MGEILTDIKLYNLLNSGSQESACTYFESIAEVLPVGGVYVVAGSRTRCCSWSYSQ